jgi:hypothetical protein
MQYLAGDDNPLVTSSQEAATSLPPSAGCMCCWLLAASSSSPSACAVFSNFLQHVVMMKSTMTSSNSTTLRPSSWCHAGQFLQHLLLPRSSHFIEFQACAEAVHFSGRDRTGGAQNHPGSPTPSIPY